jgi:hypothetical protein
MFKPKKTRAKCRDTPARQMRVDRGGYLKKCPVRLEQKATTKKSPYRAVYGEYSELFCAYFTRLKKYN